MFNFTRISYITFSTMRLFLTTISLLLITSCLNLKIKDLSAPKFETSQKISFSNKRLLLKVAYTDDELTSLSKNKINTFNSLLPQLIAKVLTEKFQSKTFLESSTPNEHQEPIDANINIAVIEHTVADETTLESIFRGLSFGFYRQYIIKEIRYEVSYKGNNHHSDETGTLITNTEFGYQAPMLIIPLNLDKHPFSVNQQIEFHKKQIGILLDKINSFI